MAARSYKYGEDLGDTAGTSSTYADKLAVTLTAAEQVASDHWAILACVLLNYNNLTPFGIVRLRDDTASGDDGESAADVKGTTDIWSHFWLSDFTSAGTPADQTHSIEYRETGSGTITVSQAALLFLKMTSNDGFAKSEAEQSNTTTTLADHTTLSLSVPSDGDYLILACGAYNTTGPNDPRAVLDIDGSIVEDNSTWIEDGTFKAPWHAVYKGTLTAGTRTIKIRFALDSGTGTVGFIYGAILALRLSDFDNVHTDSDRARTTTSSTTYQDKSVLNANPTGGPYLAIGHAKGDVDDTTSQVQMRFTEGSSPFVFGTPAFTAYSTSAATNDFMMTLLRRRSVPGSATDWKTQWRIQPIGATNVGFEYSEIALLDLGAVPIYEQVAFRFRNDDGGLGSP